MIVNIGILIILLILLIIVLIKYWNLRKNKLTKINNKYIKKEQDLINTWEKKLEADYNKKKEESNQRLNNYQDYINLQIQHLEDSYQYKNKILNETIERNATLIKQQESQKDEFLSKGKELIEQELETYKANRYKDIEVEAIKRKHQLLNEFNEQSQIIKNKLIEKENENQKIIDKLNEEKKEIELDLEDFRKRRAAVTEAILREKEIQEQENFYKIVLTDNNKEDILILREIEPKLRNKEALNKLIYDVFIKLPMTEMIKRITKGKKIGGIYKITYIKTGESYIGRSVDIGNRWKQHVLSSLNIGTIAHSSFHNFLADKGIHNFTWEILEEVPKEQQNEREKYWISFYETDKQLNSNQGG